jgi:ribulose-bisphosphate carboxylase large chain
MSRVTAIYRVRCAAEDIEARAQAIAVEQSVEMPLAAVTQPHVMSDIVGRVEAVADKGADGFEVRIGLATATMGPEAGQVMNMIFGNTSMHDDVTLEDVEFPSGFLKNFGGPRHGIGGLRALCGAGARALTCTALKPQGQSVADLASLAGRMAAGGLDYIKDDHGIADQAYSPYAKRVPAIARAVEAARGKTGVTTQYVPSVTGDLDQIRDHIRIAREEGIKVVMIPPMVVGMPSFHAAVRGASDMAFLGHPSYTGGARVSPPLMFGKLFRIFGVDASIFVNHGGRFAWPPALCARVAAAAKAPLDGLKPTVPVPAGGMTPERTPEMLDFYGRDSMLLIGGALLMARERVTEASAEFARLVRDHVYR